jgi:hypothetical protein
MDEQAWTAGVSANGARTTFSPVVELRQYTLHPGGRDALIEVFDNHLVEPQEETGMKVIGQFRDLERDDRFVWLRGFNDMEARRASLEAFYGGPVWAEHKDAANATMISSDDVLLLAPAWPGFGLRPHRSRARPARPGRHHYHGDDLPRRTRRGSGFRRFVPEGSGAVACRSRSAAHRRFRHRARPKQLSAPAGAGRRKCFHRVLALRRCCGARAPRSDAGQFRRLATRPAPPPAEAFFQTLGSAQTCADRAFPALNRFVSNARAICA